MKKDYDKIEEEMTQKEIKSKKRKKMKISGKSVFGLKKIIEKKIEKKK